MTSITLAISVVASILVLCLRPSRAFAVYIAVLLYYPTYLVVGVGSADVSASRIVIVVLLAKFLSDKNLRNGFRWCRLDGWISFYVGITIVVLCITKSPMEALENRSGFLMDTYLAYFGARFCITDRAALISVVKWVAVLLVPLAILGILESVAGWRPYGQLRQYCPWRTETTIKEGRLGFERAEGPFGQAIMFGASFVLFLPLISFLRYEKKWSNLAYIISGILVMGCLSSMSAGPLMMVMVTILCMALERYKHLVRPLLVLFGVSCVGIGIISNRPFYHVLVSYMNPFGGSGWHRCKLLDCAIETFHEWFLLGYKGVDPGWGPALGMAWTDVTNQFIIEGVRYGILGIFALVMILMTSFRAIISNYNKSRDPEIRFLCWSLGVTLVALITVWMSVNFFGQMSNLTFSVFGIIGSFSTWQTGQTERVISKAKLYGSS